MTASPEEQFGFAPDDDAPIPYMARTREYYEAIGYTTPYRWAHHIDAPFQPLKKPLSQCRVALVTTAAPFDPARGDQGPGAKYNGGAKFYQVYDGDASKTHDLRISHVAYDRVHTSAEDSGTWFPLPQLRRIAQERRIGEIAPRFFGAPTNRSHRVTLETDAPDILARCRADHVDAAVLVPNCPVCHEHAAVPRFLFSDFPLGNSTGRPHDPPSQAFTLELALRVLETAPAAQTTVQSPLRWSADGAWKRDYNNVALLSADELARRRREFDAQKEIARELRESAA